ncbi:MAG: hypothetical protein GVY05_02555, partial [Bacteroidetes bacterium]|nr:hypothetical protein [Bacteroidota bacterium]
MKNKKVDINTIIGYVLIVGLLFWMIYTQQDNLTEDKPKAEPKQTEEVQPQSQDTSSIAQPSESQEQKIPQNDSIK